MRKQHERPIINATQKQCTKCKNFKNFSDFHRYTRSPDGYKHFCKACVKEYDDQEHNPKRIYPIKEKDGLIYCLRCEEYLPIERFPDRKASTYKGKHYRYKTYCIECDKYMGHKDVYKKYNMTPEEYLELEKLQNGVCKICGETNRNGRRLAVDHDHSCCPGVRICGNCVRGLICFNCNIALGNIKDNVKTLQKMIEYLNGN